MKAIKPDSSASILPCTWQEKLLYPAFNPKRSALEHKIHLVGLVIAGSLFTLFTLGIGFLLVHNIHRTYTAYQKKANDLPGRVDDLASATSPLKKTLEESLADWAGEDKNRLIAKNSILECQQNQTPHLSLSNLDEIPGQLGELDHLEKLSLENIENLKTTSRFSNYLREVSITNCNFDPIEFDWRTFERIPKLKISGCKLTKIPKILYSFHYLEELDISNNELTECSLANSSWFDLKKLNLSNNKLTSMPTLKPFSKLNFLNLDDNHPIAALPLEALQWAKNNPNRLEAKCRIYDCLINKSSYLYLSKIDEIPEEISQLTHLEELDINDCTFDNRLDLSLFINLKKLSITKSKLAEIPKELFSLTNLEELNLSYNALTNVSSQIQALKNLDVLNLGSNQITSLPFEIGSLTELIFLDLNSNQLTSIPSTFGNLTKLFYLTVSRNQLTSIPSEISKLVHLELLALRSNLLRELPQEISALTKLTTLDLASNRFTHLPLVLFSLTNLEMLQMDDNELSLIPPEIRSLVKLNHLELSKNQLTTIPREIGFLTHLKELFLQNNQLSSVPSEMHLLTELILFNVEHNQMTAFPVEVLSMNSTLHIAAQYNQFNPEYVRNLTEVQAERRSRGDQTPELSISIYEGERKVSKLTLPQVIDFWKKHADAEIWPDFTILEKHDESLELRDFLTRVSECNDYKKSEKIFANRVMTLLKAMINEDNEFKEIAFPHIKEANTTCGDRIALGLNSLEIAFLLHEGTNAKSDVDKAAIAIGLRRIELIEKEALRIPTLDQVETKLFLHIKLKERLKLPLLTHSMLYEFTAGVSPKALEGIYNRIKTVTSAQEDIANILMEKEFWRDSIRSEDVEKYSELVEKIKDEAKKPESVLQAVFSDEIKIKVDEAIFEEIKKDTSKWLETGSNWKELEERI